MDVIEVVGESLRVSALDGSVVLGHVPLTPSDSDRRRFFARLHDRAAELGVDAGAFALAIADIRERLASASARKV